MTDLIGWQKDAVAAAGRDISIRAPRQGGKTFALAHIAALDAAVDKRRVFFTTGTRWAARSAFDEIERAFERLNLSGTLRKVTRSNDNLRFDLHNGATIVVIGRSGAGKGFSADTLIFDDADELAEEDFVNAVPTMACSTKPRILMAGIGIVPNPVWGRFHTATYSAFDMSLGTVRKTELDRFDVIQRANPLVGNIVSEDYILRMRQLVSDDVFAAEVLGALIVEQ